MLYSVVIPVFNRPEEIEELLISLTRQTFKSFEVLVIEDGSDKTCEHITEQFNDILDIRYYYKENSGQGFSRNYGFERAKGDYFIVFDSDCVIPPHYFEAVNTFLQTNNADCWGGPDRAHPSFSPLQKAINISMTSMLTTGGIRGKDAYLGNYHPRSFNMGISRAVFEATGGYQLTRMGEDIEFSIRIIKEGFKTVFIKEAYVYHKRRTSLGGFYKQLHFFGRARINIGRFYPNEVQLVHFLPVLFSSGLIFSVIALIIQLPVLKWGFVLYAIFASSLFLLAYKTEKKINIALLAVVAAFIQLSAYSIGFTSESFKNTGTKEKKK